MLSEYENKRMGPQPGTVTICQCGQDLGFRCFVVPADWTRRRIEDEAEVRWGPGRLTRVRTSTWEWLPDAEGATDG